MKAKILRTATKWQTRWYLY